MLSGYLDITKVVFSTKKHMTGYNPEAAGLGGRPELKILRLHNQDAGLRLMIQRLQTEAEIGGYRGVWNEWLLDVGGKS